MDLPQSVGRAASKALVMGIVREKAMNGKAMTSGRILVALVAALLPGTASAQESAEQVIRKGMADRGVVSGYSVNETGLPATEYRWDEERGPSFARNNAIYMSVAYATANDASGFSLIAVVQNFTNQRVCIRPRFRGVPDGQVLSSLRVNDIVDPGKSYLVLAVSDYNLSALPAVQMKYNVMTWLPNMNAPDGQKCRSSAPDILDDWANWRY
ncbi:hypothetical protein [Novosphingobium sp.]|uniref:hypothetical protein n=1 Tax=Novosphingobium sp. TaxID=1874826 RepID=UPI0035B0518A